MQEGAKFLELKFEQTHKSIKSIPQLRLPDFCVLTGPNGSGKTHLLEAINNGSVRVTIDDSLISPEQIRYLELGTVLPVNMIEHNASGHRIDLRPAN